ncbi:MAG: FAD-binding protein [Acidobacteria bacterium]|nr:FAD-binding protein [Acidobacteriota bacterium]
MDRRRKDRKRISRRDFVGKTGLGIAAVAGASAASGLGLAAQQRAASAIPAKWDLEADVVVIGSGACGLPAAIRAADHGASVIVVEANYDVGGHGMINGGQVPLGGGTSAQRKYGIVDSPEILFKDLTDWSVVETNGMPEYRYNDRAVQRALADNEAVAYEFLLENGARFEDRAPGVQGGHAIGISAPRENYARWTRGQSAESPAGSGGTGVYRPLEDSAKKKGVRFLLNYHMDVIYRQTPSSGRVLGVQASYRPRLLPGSATPMQPFRSDAVIAMTEKTVTVRARKAVIIATGGSSSHVHFRRMFDPRLTEEYQVAGEPYSTQDASGELAALAVGATLWGTANQTMERNGAFRKRPVVGAQHIYPEWTPKSPVFPFVRATGLHVSSWADMILVNQVGRRFYNEDADGWPYGTHHGFLDPYIHGDWRNGRRITYKPQNFLDAALAVNEGSQPPDYNAGPIWAIFDADAVVREKWDLSPPATDSLYFFSGRTLAEVAAQVRKNPYQKADMPAGTLEATVARYNAIVDFGYDPDFERPNPKYKIQTPPFYAAWATPVVHDTYAGLRINVKCQVMDFNGEVIPGLYCGGESAGGCSQHGQGRAITQGVIAGKEAALERISS